MNEKIKLLKVELENAKAEYARKRTSFLALVDCEIDTYTFEKNAISDLTEMLEIKIKICTLTGNIHKLEYMRAED